MVQGIEVATRSDVRCYFDELCLCASTQLRAFNVQQISPGAMRR